MKKIFNYMFAALVGCATLTSCLDDALETAPTGSMSGDALLGSASTAIIPLNGIYRSMYATWSPQANEHQSFGISSYNLMADVMGEDMIQAAQGSGWFWFDCLYQVKSRFESTAWRSYDVWNCYYTWISNANYIIDREETMTGDADDVAYIIGQAYAIRAYSYFMLAQTFARTYDGHEDEPCCPIYTEPTQAGTQGNPRSTVRQVYEQIVSDMDEHALPLLEGKARQHITHISYAVACGLRARIALVMNDWTTARQAAINAINAAGQEGRGILPVASFRGLNDASAANVMWGASIIADQTGAYASFFSHMDACDELGPTAGAYGASARKQISRDWQQKGLYNMAQEAGTWSVEQKDGTIALQIRNTYKGKLDFNYQTDIQYTVSADGSILVNSTIIPSKTGEIIPKVGYRMELPEGFERMRWYGRGPWENYVDRKESSYFGLYESTVSDQWINYVRPQEMGNHEDTRWISITNPQGMGFVYVAGDKMSVSALHVRAQDMTSADNIQKMVHGYEITPRKETILCLDAANRPLGNASCGPGPLKKYELTSQPTVFSFILLPLERSYTNDELSRKARVRMPVCMPVLIERDNNGDLHMSTHTSGATIHYRINGGEYQTYSKPFALIEGGNVEAYAVSDELGQSLKTTVQLPIYVDRSIWKIVSVSSENNGEEARNAIDGDPSSIWHSRWSEPEAKHPHSIVVDMGSMLVIDQFIYTPRDSGNGRIKDYELYFSKDGKTWDNPVKGRFPDSSSAQVVKLGSPVTARYFKFVALSEMYGRAWASVAELNVNIVQNLSGAASNKQSIISVDSDADNSMKLAADGDIQTCWQTVLNGFYRAPYPHEIQIGLAKEATIKGLKYTPRQDSEEGRIAAYEIYVSNDGNNWGKPVATGTFAPGKDTQTVTFKPCKARYVKLTAQSAHDKGRKAAIAELEIIVSE